MRSLFYINIYGLKKVSHKNVPKKLPRTETEMLGSVLSHDFGNVKYGMLRRTQWVNGLLSFILGQSLSIILIAFPTSVIIFPDFYSVREGRSLHCVHVKQKGVERGGDIISRNISQPWTTITPKQCCWVCPLVNIRQFVFTSKHIVSHAERGILHSERQTRGTEPTKVNGGN
jgi:hypothetical protein